MVDTQVGKVIHFYDKAVVAVVALDRGLKVGDQIKIVQGKDELVQLVESMQMDHKGIDSAKKGDEVGLKVDQPVKRNALVYKLG